MPEFPDLYVRPWARHILATSLNHSIYSSVTLAISAWVKINCTCAHLVGNQSRQWPFVSLALSLSLFLTYYTHTIQGETSDIGTYTILDDSFEIYNFRSGHCRDWLPTKSAHVQFIFTHANIKGADRELRYCIYCVWT